MLASTSLAGLNLTEGHRLVFAERITITREKHQRSLPLGIAEGPYLSVVSELLLQKDGSCSQQPQAAQKRPLEPDCAYDSRVRSAAGTG
ncbi:hypothetical protein NA56DRAFT_698932 [Hyaloscypha hepaticicola]|uniref:Uncharacterized protein n=1 Tax=Hyaloscypha hepaticicola TaxID=2082293 RepID=A0A2J6QHX3_9HELO|nr:hypothetical protein NA56DRAFT_698932 [Hyaloscypha hepaticicola]